VDRQVAGPRPTPTLADRRAAGEQEQGHAVPGGVDHAHEGVGEADIDVDHDRKRSACYEPVAMRHCDCSGLMRHGDWRRYRQPCRGRAGEALDQGREVSAGVGQQVVDPALLQHRQQRLRGGGNRQAVAL
jgi:hypothetical protein